MSFQIYEEAAEKTAIYPRKYGVMYTVLGLAGEAGELANMFKKVIRDGDAIITEEKKRELLLEAGDVLWYLTMFAREMGVSLQELADMNLAKLQSRQERGKLQGSGDER